MNYISNSFSLNMLQRESAWPVRLVCVPVTAETARQLAPMAQSIVGHENTAALFSSLLGCPVACERATAQLTPDDSLLVGQYCGPRLPEGATELPAGAAIKWWLLTVS